MDDFMDFKVTVSLKDLDIADKDIWMEIISSGFDDCVVDKMGEYLKQLKSIVLEMSAKYKNIKTYRKVKISADNCWQCKNDKYVQNGTICFKHLIEVLKTNDNPMLEWYPGYIMSGGSSKLLCGCSMDRSCCAGIEGFDFQCKLHDNRTYLDALMDDRYNF